jgi:Pyruvate/2-oxoacid:ferredoxin oxidoreductase gamma subunit
MKYLFTALAAAVAVSLLGACATPTVVESKQANDRNLSCEGLKSAYIDAKDFESKARKERGVTGTNVAAAIFFWPAMLGTYKNTEDAIEASKERQKHLEAIAAEKKCPPIN